MCHHTCSLILFYGMWRIINWATVNWCITIFVCSLILFYKMVLVFLFFLYMYIYIRWDVKVSYWLSSARSIPLFFPIIVSRNLEWNVLEPTSTHLRPAELFILKWRKSKRFIGEQLNVIIQECSSNNNGFNIYKLFFF